MYAYGMIVFEVLTGDNPWRGLNQMQIMMQVCIKKEPPDRSTARAPADLVALMRRCWDHEPDARPDFAAIILAELRGGSETPAKYGPAVARRQGSRRPRTQPLNASPPPLPA